MPDISVRSLITTIGACVAVTTAVSAPLGYGVIGYWVDADQLSLRADVSAQRVSRYVYQHGSMWPFHHVRLGELIQFTDGKSKQIKQRIVTAQGQLVLSEDVVLATPTMMRSAPIVEGGSVVGHLEVEAGARPLIINTAWVALLSTLLGTIAYFSIRIFPLRVLDRTLAELGNKAVELERAQLAQEQSRMQAEAARRQGLLNLADHLERDIRQIAGAVSEAAAATEGVSQAVAASVSSADDHTRELTQAAGQAGSSVRAASIATEAVTVSFAEVVDKMSEASTVAKKATIAARHANAMVEKLSGSARKVDEIVKMINAIAAQTNLLALNATIEAARAGDAGRGFAVVAHEVKGLAAQTAKATETIATQIADIQATTTQTVTAIHDIGEIVVEIDTLSGAVMEVVREQQRATSEIADSAHQATIGTDKVASQVDVVKRAVTNTSAVAEASLGAANELRCQADALMTSLDQFLMKVRAA